MSNYNPLNSIAIPNVGQITPKGLLVIVGPNSCGKTQMLKDIQSCVTGDPRELVVLNDVAITKPPNYDAFLDTLRANGAIKDIVENATEILECWSPHLGVGKGAWKLQPAQLKNWYQQAEEGSQSSLSSGKARPFYQHCGPMMITSLFLDRRLTMTNEAVIFDYQKKPPTGEMQALYMRKDARQALTEELRKTFGKAVWLDNTRNVLCLRVSDSPDLPSAEDRLEPESMSQFRTIESEGDGLKSYAAICVSLLLGRRPVCLIDEPEMCLHPPQAYALGRFIGRHGTSSERATFVATHSSHVLRGIVDETSELELIRLSRSGTHFCGDKIPYAAIRECIERPTTKIETILDGVFAEAVTIVESEGDRLVYGATWERVNDEFDRDVHFVSVGGLGGIAHTCELYKRLGIPLAIIADLDLICKADFLKAIMRSLTHDDEAAELLTTCRETVTRILNIKPGVSEGEVEGLLREILDQKLNWENRDDEGIQKRLSGLASKLGRTTLLKSGGVASFGEYREIQHSLTAVMARCRSFGLFLVPVGELECWIPELMEGGPSRKKKSEWANSAATRIREAPPEAGDIWNFVRTMAAFQRDQAGRLSGYPLHSADHT